MTNRSKTVRRNSKLYTAIFANAEAGKSFSLDNGFTGREMDVAWIRKEGEARARRSEARISDNGDGTYTVHNHSNSWFEVSAPNAATACKPVRKRARKAAKPAPVASVHAQFCADFLSL